MYASPTAQRFMIYSALIGATLYGFGCWYLTGFIPPPSPTLTSADVMHLYADENFKFRLGVVLCLISGGFNAPWSVAVAVQMARCERGVPVWAIAQLVAGTLGTILFVAPPLFWGVAAFSVERDPAITLMMHELAFLTFVTPVSFFWLQALPIAFVGLRRTDVPHSAFPRWIGYASAWIIACAELGVIAQMFKTGPFAWNGLFTFWIPLIAFAIWLPVLSFTMLRAIKLQENSHETEGVARGQRGIPATA